MHIRSRLRLKFPDKMKTENTTTRPQLTKDLKSEDFKEYYFLKEELKEDFVNLLLDCPLPLSAGGQKESFQMLIEEYK